jgi:hypothetical protein
MENNNNIEGNGWNSSTIANFNIFDAMGVGSSNALVRLQILFSCKAKGKKNLSVAEITMTILSLTLFFLQQHLPDIGGGYLVWL